MDRCGQVLPLTVELVKSVLNLRILDVLRRFSEKKRIRIINRFNRDKITDDYFFNRLRIKKNSNDSDSKSRRFCSINNRIRLANRTAPIFHLWLEISDYLDQSSFTGSAEEG